MVLRAKLEATNQRRMAAMVTLLLLGRFYFKAEVILNDEPLTKIMA